MRTKIYLSALLAGVFALQSCDNDNDDQVKNVPATVKSVFTQKYPGSTVREWEKKSGHYVAEFSNDNAEADAWFTSDGTWLYTETDYYDALPAVVSEYISSNYPSATIDDVDFIETPTDSYLRIELDRQHEKDTDIYIRKDGTVLKVVDGNSSAQVTEAAKTAFAEKYPDATVREWEEKMTYIVADFSLNGVEAEAYFKQDGTWLYTETDYNGFLPTAVTEYIAANYPSTTMDDTDLISTPTDEYYEIEFEQRRGEDIKLHIRADGTLVL